MIEPLAISDHYESTNLSRAHSLSLFDEDQTDLETKDEFVEYFIDHDPSHPMPPMSLQNVTSLERSPRLFFHFHLLNLSSLSQHLTYSIRLDMIPINGNLSYLLIYRFKQMPLSTHSIEQVDGWKLFCSKDGRFSHLIRQFRRSNHHSIVYGIRQLTMWETMDFCLDRKEIGSLNDHVLFTDDYYLRFSRSGCFYLDENQQWNSEGLIVCHWRPLVIFHFALLSTTRSVHWRINIKHTASDTRMLPKRTNPQ